MRQKLTDEQHEAATCSDARLYIEAVPGSGKTTVAAERFGVIRYDTACDPRRILALSFTRSARDELKGRIVSRWGGTALSWPHRALTLDGLHHEIVTYLLRRRAIRWIGDQTELTMLETWRGHRGVRPIEANAYRRVVVLDGTTINSRSVKQGVAGHFITGKQEFETHLSEGRCTTTEIRQIVDAVVRHRELRAEVSRYLVETVKAVIVDEVFDANLLDLSMIRVLVSNGISTTLIGDPWQALYRFRGARPEDVGTLVRQQHFETRPVSRTFRFGPEMGQLAENAREGRRVLLKHASTADRCDVILARKWQSLWDGPDHVLPLSFGRPRNQTDAAVELLLDPVIQGRFGRPAHNAADAAAVLGIDRRRLQSDGALNPVLELVRLGTTDSATDALILLRRILKESGSSCQLRPMAAPSEEVQISRLVTLARRLHRPRVIPGMTVHQAKGREWPVVGLYLGEDDIDRLAAGLIQHRDDDRVLYVALTRASHKTLRC
ncbi:MULTISPECIES: UvrD-helicase domain-containing protein [unclassified Nocardia]|uniref:UvrD-helicase domain-containing protein n=1 Tax=unclassified Nocardia TaxID=2637762 RepID=UPI001CE40629|nr:MULTISPECIES: UvrD-helicase domain-containing protein [unclassified Nocardia]